MRAYPADEPLWRIGLYLRLSREDARQGESASIANQEKILRDFVADYFAPGSYTIDGVFADDGLSGTDTARPDFQRLRGCLARQELNCMVVKSLARGFRNLADQQKFLEEFLPLVGARFICASSPFMDTYADPRGAAGLEVPIRGMFNEQFAAATSEEIRKTFNMKRQRGEFIGAFAPYGYRKDPADKNHLLIDEDAAAVVAAIYRWFVDEGYSKAGIARRLNQLGEPNPAAYKQLQGLNYRNPHAGLPDSRWSAATVAKILRNEVYTGAMVQGRQRVISYKVHKQVNVPPQQWFVVPGTHQPIIDAAVFAQAQSLQQHPARTAPGERRLHLLSGLVRCAGCRKAMRRKSSGSKVYYVCRSRQQDCCRHSLREDELLSALLAVLRVQFALGGAELAARLAEITPQEDERRLLTRRLRQAEQQCQRCRSAAASLYPDWKSGEISREEYLSLKRYLTQEQRQLTDKIAVLQQQLAGREAAEPPWRALCGGTAESLDRGLLTTLVETVWVERQGELTIDFTFSDSLRRLLEE